MGTDFFHSVRVGRNTGWPGEAHSAARCPNVTIFFIRFQGSRRTVKAESAQLVPASRSRWPSALTELSWTLSASREMVGKRG